MENDEGDEDESENENAVTDSEDEDEHYQGSSSVDIVKELQVGCMKNVNLGQEASPVDEECEPMLEQNTTVDFHGKGLKGKLINHH